MLGDRQFRHVRHEPCGEREFAERRGQAMPFAQCVERGAGGALALGDALAPRLEVRAEAGGVGRQVGRAAR